MARPQVVTDEVEMVGYSALLVFHNDKNMRSHYMEKVLCFLTPHPLRCAQHLLLEGKACARHRFAYVSTEKNRCAHRFFQFVDVQTFSDLLLRRGMLYYSVTICSCVPFVWQDKHRATDRAFG